MASLLWLVPALPLAGFILLTILGSRASHRVLAWIGAGSVGIAALLSIGIAIGFLQAPPPGNAVSQTLWTWMQVGKFAPGVSLYLDPLSLIMMLVVTFVGFFIHLYSAEFMHAEEGYSRFFAYMNLFVGSMLILVLSDNLLLLYLGWEGVGLCSYLLIGFWYKDANNGYAARKAFIVTRVGDTAMGIGLFLLFTNLGTLQIQPLMQLASQHWPVGSGLATAAAALLLGGAVGKSAQLPLQTWLPDAMAGPTPVSALIHAATMVTAGVYLIARTHVLFSLAPGVQLAVAIVGGVTLLLAGFSALTQWDIKRVLAYSTISQIGYMFLALGVGAWSAAIFHLVTHAFFKALLFLGAGVVIEVLHDEHNMFKMGGLRHQLPLVFWTFFIGACSLAAVPLVTAGFYSKDLILWQTFSSLSGSVWLWLAGLVGAFLTSIYSFRMVFVTFFGEAKQQVTHKPGLAMQVPLVVLAVFSIFVGFIELPSYLGRFTLFSDFTGTVLPPVTQAQNSGVELLVGVVAGLVSLAGIYLAYLFFLRRPRLAARLVQAPVGGALHRYWFSGWAFDWLYDRLLVWPYLDLANGLHSDVIDLFYRGLSWLTRAFSRALSLTQTGMVRWYALGILLGAVVIIFLAVVL
jgi:NADH-quinone oxidoreductase subunit L